MQIIFRMHRMRLLTGKWHGNYIMHSLHTKKQYHLSQESGVPKATVADICSGKVKIRKCAAETIYKIAKVLDVSMKTIIEENLKKLYDRYREKETAKKIRYGLLQIHIPI